MATAADKAALAAAFVAYDQIPAGDITGTQSGSVYLATVPSTGTTWALASFEPSTTAGQQTLVRLQDGGRTAIFSKKSGAGWVVLSNGAVPFCPSQTALPPAVVALWGLTDAEGCTAAGTTTTTGAAPVAPGPLRRTHLRACRRTPGTGADRTAGAADAAGGGDGTCWDTTRS